MKPYRTALVLSCALMSCWLASLARATDWPNYRGPKHDQTSDEKILKKWPEGGLKEVWRRPVGASFGTFSVVGNRAYYFGEKDQMEILYAMDADTGKDRWERPIGPTTNDRSGGPNPRSTPTVDGERVYLMSTKLKLLCLDAAIGKVIWEHDLVKEYGGRNIGWENAMSPVVEGDLVIVACGAKGSSFMAFDKAKGDLKWKGESDGITHATPTPATIHGVRQIIFFTQTGGQVSNLVGVEPTTGKVLWRQEHPYKTATAASPVIGGPDGDIVFCSAGYGMGGGSYQVVRNDDGWSVKVLKQTPGQTMNHWMTPVYKDGYLYGLFGHAQQRTAPLKCVEIATLKEVWSKEGFGHGGTIIADGCVLVQGDQGQFVLVEATPDGYKELARMQPLRGKCWSMPVLANGKVYLHSTTEAVCLDIKP